MHYPMDVSKFQKIKKAFENNGGIIASSLEIDQHLDKYKAEAATIDGKTILMRTGIPSVSARRWYPLSQMRFEFTVEDALHIPGTDIISVIGTKSDIPIRIGSLVSDGVTHYSVTSVPFIHRDNTEEIDKTCIAIKAGDYCPHDLVGKTLLEVKYNR